MRSAPLFTVAFAILSLSLAACGAPATDAETTPADSAQAEGGAPSVQADEVRPEAVYSPVLGSSSGGVIIPRAPCPKCPIMPPTL